MALLSVVRHLMCHAFFFLCFQARVHCLRFFRVFASNSQKGLFVGSIFLFRLLFVYKLMCDVFVLYGSLLVALRACVRLFVCIGFLFLVFGTWSNLLFHLFLFLFPLASAALSTHAHVARLHA